MKKSFLATVYLLIFVATSVCFGTLSITTLHAAHIVGGEVTYECLGGNQYRIHITVYKDCFNVNPTLDPPMPTPFDNPAHVGVFNATGTPVLSTIQIPFPGAEEIAPPEDICVETLPNVCIEKAIYSRTINLPSTAGVYTVVYQRYSRNNVIVNINNPGDTGSSYSVEIPHPGNGECNNNSPVFTDFPPIVVCNNNPLRIDQSAIDADGDQLVYELCTPLIGGSASCIVPGTECPIQPPPYAPVTWIPPFNATNPIGGSPPLSFDPNTGFLTGTPNRLGQYVVGICVSEYRDGVRLSTVRRDFQFFVADCNIVAASIESDEIMANGTYVLTDCDNFNVQFINTSIGANEYEWVFPDGTSETATNPTYDFGEAGTYTILLRALNGSCSDDAEIIVNIYPTLTTDFTFESMCAGDKIQFRDNSIATHGNIDSYQWYFGDEGMTTTRNPRFAFDAGGNYTVSLVTTTDLGCRDSIAQTVEVFHSPSPVFDRRPACLGSPVTFFIPNNVTLLDSDSIHWDFGDPTSDSNISINRTNPNHTFDNIGEYYITLSIVTEDGCAREYTDTLTIYPDIRGSIDLGQDVAICEGESTTLQVMGNVGTDYKYRWLPPETLDVSNAATVVATPTTDAVYSVTVTDPSGCKDADSIQVEVRAAPNVSAGDDATICFEDMIDLQGQVDPNVVVFRWTGIDLDNNTTLNPTISPIMTTDYILTARDEVGCANKDTVTINVIPQIDISITEVEGLCEGSSVQLNAMAFGTNNYTWTPALGLSDPNIANPIANPSVPTQYTVSTNNQCFTVSDSVFLNIFPLPVADAGPPVDINVGEAATLMGSGSGGTGVLSYEWIPNDGVSDPTAAITDVTATQSAIYTLTVTDENGCMASDTVRADITNIFELLLPNAFSPNNDGLNDVYKISRMRGVREITAFRIYNRWGTKVFESAGENAAWDGRFNGRILEIGTYTYYITAITFLDEEMVWKGTINLLR